MIIAAAKVGAVMFLSTLTGCDDVKVLFRKIRGKLKTQPKEVSRSQRTLAVLPERGEKISVEMALNSRCTSDYDNDPSVLHWGMFDSAKKINNEQIENIVDCVNRMPRIVDGRAEVILKGNLFAFTIDNASSAGQRDLLMIQSGVQQQATGLLCAARGIGNAFRSLGKDGRKFDEKSFGMVRMKLDAMKPSYNSSYWTDTAPEKERPWQKGNLPDPERNGKVSLVEAIKRMTFNNPDGHPVSSIEELGQLL